MTGYRAERIVANAITEADTRHVLELEEFFGFPPPETMAEHRVKPKDSSKSGKYSCYRSREAARRRLFKSQGGLCELCGARFESDRDGLVDHCHKSDRIRALLCPSCNTRLAGLESDKQWLNKAQAYIAKHTIDN